MNEQVDTSPAVDAPKVDAKTWIVGIGASAGGIAALSAFFKNAPVDSGMAYVVILHLSPDHDSKLAAVLQTATRMPVAQVTERTRVQPDHVYVISPDKHLVMLDDDIAVVANVSIQERRAPVDIFFRTLAASHHGRAISVVLSGTGANGSMGLKRIKEHGGIVIAQQPAEAQFDEMPRNAIATGFVDQVLSVADIPAAVAQYKASAGRVRIALEPEGAASRQQDALGEVFTLLRVRTGHDFTNYKRPTLLRRIERRINVRQCDGLDHYARYLRDSQEETQALLRDLLISVTSFFRDTNAWRVIEDDALAPLIRSKSGDEQVRIWCAGCATGEEAYSLAIACVDIAATMVEAPAIQIFATDIDDRAIGHAREGCYTLNDVPDVPPERLARYFSEVPTGFRVRREIRERVLFASHNVLKDPPFSQLDMVVCRNVLIYFNRAAQQRALGTFHFALKPGGFLFLGSSETVEGSTDLFGAFNAEQHVFQSRHVAARPYSLPNLPGSPLRFDLPARTAAPDGGAVTAAAPRPDRITHAELHLQLLEQYAPPSLVVNEDHEIVHLSPRAGRYLAVAGGEPTSNLLKLARDELRVELRSALFQAAQRQAPVDVSGLRVRIDDREEVLDLHVRPIVQRDNPARGFTLIVFQPSSPAADLPPRPYSPEEPIARRLEEEIARIKAQLRISTEQHEAHSEEMQASNEELQAMNEELRSAAEELETSKEELQSMNEELTTVNQELKVKIEEVSQSSNDLQNLINSTNIATLFLDRSLRVKLFTPATQRIFNLIRGDIGRPVSDITTRLKYDGMLEDAREVLQNLQAVEREVADAAGRVYSMRGLPYRTTEDHIGGVVFTFIDVTELRHTEEELSRSQTEFEPRVLERTRELSALNEALRRKSIDRDVADEARATLSRQLAHAQEEERRRIARDLHDELGQQVSAMSLHLRLLQDVAQLPPKAKDMLQSLEFASARLDSALERLVWQLRPTALDDLGLVEALTDYVHDWSLRFRIPASCDCAGMKSERLASEIETVIYRVAQEALTNAGKYSLANKVEVTLARVSGEIVLLVADDGVGFDVDEARGQALGLIGMRERAALVGGTVAIETKPGAGTSVTVRIAVPQPVRP